MAKDAFGDAPRSPGERVRILLNVGSRHVKTRAPSSAVDTGPTLSDDELRDLLYGSVSETLMLRPAWPPRGDARATSYFGGLPTLPERLAWPEGKDGHLPLVAQIDLGRLPDFPVRHLLPPRGALYFFWNARWGDAALNVLFAEEDPALLPARSAPPRPMLTFADRSGLVHNFPDRKRATGFADHGAGSNDLPAGFPRWALEFVATQGFAERPARTLDRATANRYMEMVLKAQRDAYVSALGTPRFWRMPSVDALSKDPPPPDGYPFQAPDQRGLWLPDDAWPYSWLHVHACGARILDDLEYRSRDEGPWGPDRFPEGTSPDALQRVLARIQAARDGARAWKAEAVGAGAFRPVPQERRAAFLAWIAAIASPNPFPDPDWARIDPEGRDAPWGSPEHDAFRTRNAEALRLREEASDKYDPLCVGNVNHKILGSLIRATDVCIAYADEPAALLPAPVLDYWRPHSAPWGFGQAIRHQLLGAPGLIQGAAKQYRDTHALLAQFDTEAVQFQQLFVGLLQYWIPRDDLREGRFDRVKATLVER